MFGVGASSAQSRQGQEPRAVSSWLMNISKNKASTASLVELPHNWKLLFSLKTISRFQCVPITSCPGSGQLGQSGLGISAPSQQLLGWNSPDPSLPEAKASHLSLPNVLLIWSPSLFTFLISSREEKLKLTWSVAKTWTGMDLCWGGRFFFCLWFAITDWCAAFLQSSCFLLAPLGFTHLTILLIITTDKTGFHSSLNSWAWVQLCDWLLICRKH